VGSAEFCLSYSSTRGITPLMDNGHYHPTESVADKISSLLLFNEKIALHVTRGVRWDSDHVVSFDDECRDIAREAVRCGVDKIFFALDYFDASINRIAAWVIGARNLHKSLLLALLSECDAATEAQNKADYTRMLLIAEEMKSMPFAEVWDEYCRRAGVSLGMEWYSEVEKYEAEVLSKR
jgi:L-rhamnose isomerase